MEHQTHQGTTEGGDVDRLRKDAERFALAVRGSNEGIWDWDILTDEVYYSDRLKELLGFTAGDSFPGVVESFRASHPDDRDRALQALRDHLENASGDEHFDVECRFRMKDGEYLWCRVRGMAVRDGTGKATRMAGSLTNISPRKKAEEELAEERNLLRTVMDNVPVHIYIKDRESRFLRVNDSMAHWVGAESGDDLQGKTDRDFFDKEHYEQARRDEERVMETGKPLDGEVERETWPDKEDTWCLTTKMPLLDSVGNIIGTFGVSSDVSELVTTQHALQRAMKDLEASNFELEQFAYVASHDLQEPLRMVGSYVQLLARRYQDKLDAEADEFIGFALDGVKRMQRLINDLLTYSRVGTRGREPVEIEMEQVIRDVLSNLMIAIEESDARVTHDALPAIRADPTQMTQLFQNLVGNAIKFHGDKPPRAHVSAEHDGRFWRFRVRDEGIGIDPSHQERVFQIFQRLHARDAYEGTGIGLAVCRKIVERHGGEIHIESEPEQGCTFVFTLPEANAGDFFEI